MKFAQTSEFLDENSLICYCEDVTVGAVIEAVKNGASSVDDVRRVTGACKSGKRCRELNPHKRCCIPDIKNLVEQLTKIY